MAPSPANLSPLKERSASDIKHTLRRILFWTHLVVGVGIGLVILSMCVTGSILAFEPQILNWAERDLLKVTVPASDAKPLESDILLAAVGKENPEAKPSYIMFKADPEASAMVGLGKEGVLFVDPYTGRVLGKGSKTRETLHDVEEWHRWLGNKKVGKPITGATAIGFGLLSLSGLYLWWPRKVYTLRGEGHAGRWNWHNTIGLSMTPFILLITITGVIMSYGLLKKNSPPRPKTEPSAVRVIRPQPETNAWPGPKALHTGRSGGLPTQMINFVVALAGILQVWTGFAMAWRRFRSRNQRL